MADNDAGPARFTLLLTRPRDAAARFALEAAARWPGASVVIAPLMEVVPVGKVPPLDEVDGVIFTSANAVARAGQGHGKPAWCVGARTTEAARQAGFDAVMTGETADELVPCLTERRPTGRIVHLHGVHQRGDVVERLSQSGLSVEGAAVYDQRAVPPDSQFFDALAARPLVVPLFSPRSGVLFAEAAEAVLGPELPEGVDIVALSEAVRQSLPQKWRQPTTLAARPDAEAILDEITRRIFR
jgi:uroporphyrinogen-III synthase